MLRIAVGPIREHNGVILVGTRGFAAARLNHDRPVQPALLLKARMRVIPISTVLLHPESINIRLSGSNARKAQPGYAIHLRWHEYAMPMNGARDRHAIGDANRYGVAFTPTQQRCRKLAIYCRSRALRTRVVHREGVDRQ